MIINVSINTEKKTVSAYNVDNPNCEYIWEDFGTFDNFKLNEIIDFLEGDIKWDLNGMI